MGHESDMPSREGLAQEEPHSSRLPFSQILAFTTTNLAQGVMLTMPFTVAVYMVRTFLGGEGDEAQIGRLTGLLAAVYSFAQFTTSYAWGIFSSRFGRKPVMVLGSAASAVTLLWFGLSGGFTGAIAARVVAGLLNGIIVAWKCSIGESCDALEQGRVMSYMSLSWGIGCILGPSIGGVASMPCASWAALPGCCPDGLLYIRPYFLPCAISAAVNALALCLNLFVLRETLPSLVAAKASQQSDTAHSSSERRDGSSSGKHSRSSLAADAHQEKQQHAAAAPPQGMLQAAAARVQAGTSRLWQLLGRAAPRSYERVSSHTSAPLAGGGEATCGPGCTGCSVCWALWRAESGLVQGCTPDKLPQLRHDDSAGNLELAVIQGGVAAGTVPAVHPGGAINRPQQQQQQQQQLHPNDSASEHMLRRAHFSNDLKDSNKVRQLREIQQQHSGYDKLQHCRQHPAQDCGEVPEQGREVHCESDQQQQQQQGAHLAPLAGSECEFDSSLDQSSDCTIVVSNQQQPGSTRLMQEQGAACERDSLLSKQPQPASSSSQLAASSQQQPWYKQRQVVLVLLAYGTVCLLFCAIDELTPIFASAPVQQGGLKLSEVQLAGPLSFSGACLILVSLFALPAAQKAWGTLAVTRQGLVTAVLVLFAIPCTSFAAQAHSSSGTAAGIGGAAWGLLYVAMLLKSFAGCFAFTGTMILVNTSVEDPQALGAVNGVGQSLASLARGVGPAVGGLLWGMTVHSHLAGAQLLPFACVAGTAVVALLLYAFVHPRDGVEAQVPSQGTSCCQE